MMKKIGIPAVAVLVATVGFTPASAPASIELPASPSVVNVQVEADGLFVTRDAVHGGPVTFVVETSDANPHWVGVFRTNDGVSVDTYLQHLTEALSDDPATGVAGERKVLRDGQLLSGAAVYNKRSVTLTTRLAPGRYYLADYASLGRPGVPPAVHPLDVQDAQFSLPALGTTHILIRSTRDGDRFLMPSVLPARGRLITYNATDQINESVIRRVRPGTTEADLRRFFTKFGSDGFNPFVEPHSYGLIPMSPRISAQLSYDLPPGTYAVMSWVRNLNTGHPNVSDGTFKLVRLIGRAG